MLARLAFFAAVLLAGSVPAAADDPEKPAGSSPEQQLKHALVGTWDCVAQDPVPKRIKHVKLVTPGRYLWVTYDAETDQLLSTSGGTWALKEGKYEETCDFASDSHQHLRGKTFAYNIEVKEDRWTIKIGADGEIDVDEVWNRIAPTDRQKQNAQGIGRRLVGAWKGTLPARAPKAARIIKLVTPTHWTWVVYDRENKMVLNAMGGTWSLKGDQYEETVDFTAEELPGAQGQSFSYDFKMEDDQWLIKRGPKFDARTDESWKRIK